MNDNMKGLELLTEQERQLIIEYRQMTKQQQNEFLEYIKQLAKECEQQKGVNNGNGYQK